MPQINSTPRIVMIGTSLNLPGGVAAVLNVYRENGFFDRWGVQYISTNCQGSQLRKATRSIVAALQFFGVLLRGGGDLVHVHTSSGLSFWRKTFFIIPALIFRRSLVISLHGGGFRDFYSKKSGPIAKWWIRFIMRKAARFIVLTRSWKDWVLSIVPEARVCTIPNVCFDVNSFPIELVERMTAKRILFIGRLEKEKGFHDLLLAVSRLRENVPGIELLCGGCGDERQVKKWIETAGIGDLVKLRGWVSGLAKQECFAQAKLLVLPSYIENLPMVIIEAMSAGLPVVASAVGGIPDVIELGEEGILIPPGDVGELANAIACLLQDEPKRAAMGRNARKKYENYYSPHCVIPRLELIYKDLGMRPL